MKYRTITKDCSFCNGFGIFTNDVSELLPDIECSNCKGIGVIFKDVRCWVENLHKNYPGWELWPEVEVIG